MYIIAWRYNSKVHTMEFNLLEDAIEFTVELESFGLNPSIHKSNKVSNYD